VNEHDGLAAFINRFVTISESVKPIDITHQEEQTLWDRALESEQSDRALTIVALCLIDQLLQKLIRKAFVSHRKSDVMFNDEHFLRTTSSKINMAFFLGLIPDTIYDDLKIINTIRNKFAHTVTDKLNFDNPVVYDLLIRCKLGPTNMGLSRMAKLRFTIAIQQLIDYLLMFAVFYDTLGPKKLIDLWKLNDKPWHTMGLPKEKLLSNEGKCPRLQWFKVGETPIVEERNQAVCVDRTIEPKDGDFVMYEDYNNGINMGSLKTVDGVLCVLNYAGTNPTPSTEFKTVAKVVKRIYEY
jgi:DNA-binding MltR family transcriptional regulator